MQETPVVTCFLKNCGDILLLKRGKDVSSYPGKWSGVSGYIENLKKNSKETPKSAAKREIKEETGLNENNFNLLRQGESFIVVDQSLNKKWRIYPFLFHSNSRKINLNWESVKSEWASPTEILKRQTVPKLWESYKRIAPTLDEVVNDSEHGSSYILARCIEVIRDKAGEMMKKDEFKDHSENLDKIRKEIVQSHPSMAALSNKTEKILEHSSVEEIEEKAHKELKKSLRAKKETVENSIDLISGKKILTLSRSETVKNALESADLEKILVAESKPGKEGQEIAKNLNAEVILDSEISKIIQRVDLVLIGADTILCNGNIINKVGSKLAALSADYYSVPFYVASSTNKIKCDIHNNNKESDIFEQVPSNLVTGIVSEFGIFEPSDLIEKIKQDR